MIMNNTIQNVKLESPIFLSTVSNNVDTNTVKINSVDELCTLICNNTWSPATYKNNKRLLVNFNTTQIIGLDIDSGLSIADCISKLSGFQFIVAPTRNNMVEKNGKIEERYRVILFLNGTISDNATYNNTWESILKILPQIDKAARDCSRQFFASQFIHSVHEGLRYPVIKNTPPKPAVRLVPNGKYPIPKSVNQFMTVGVSENWNKHLFVAAKQLQEAGFELDDAISTLELMQNPNYSGHLDNADLKTIKSAFNTPGKYNPLIEWPVMITSKNGVEFPDPSNQNNFMFLANDILKLDIKYNELRNCIELGEKSWDDMDLSFFRMKCRDFNLKPTQELLDDVIRHIAYNNKYHPLKKAIEDTVWDGHDYIEDLYKTITIEGEELPIYRTYLRRWLIGMVRKIYVPKTQTNVLTFLGNQSIGKSLWLEKFSIIPNIFNESQVNPDSKDDKIRCTNTLIWSISEIDAVTKKSDAAALKSFLTDSTFDIRSPYDKYAKQLTAVCSFCASVNERNFLVDSTGNRRFNIIPVLMLNKTHDINMFQVFAQAYALHLTGERHWFDYEEVQEINMINEEYMPATRTDYLVASIVPGEDQLNADELLTILGYKDSRNSFDFRMLGRSLSLIGIQNKRKVIQGHKYTVYLINKSETIANLLKAGGL